MNTTILGSTLYVAIKNKHLLKLKKKKKINNTFDNVNHTSHVKVVLTHALNTVVGHFKFFVPSYKRDIF